MRYRLLWTFLLAVNLAWAQEIEVMTYNIRLSLESDGENAWSKRAEEVVDLLNYYEPSILGVQEALPKQMDYIQKGLPSYRYVGVGRDDGKRKGEFSALFYDASKFELLQSGTFWLSLTPNVPSKGWDAAYPRICSYGLLKSKKDGKQFWAFNLHFDHVGDIAREESAKLIIDKISKLNTKGYPVVLTGDFNLESDTVPIKLLSKALSDSFLHSKKKPYGPKGTFTGFETKEPAKVRIDYIFTKGFETLNYRVIEDRRENLLYPSDHFPVLSTLRFSGK